MSSKLIAGLIVVQLVLFAVSVPETLELTDKLKGINKTALETSEFIQTNYSKNSKLAVYFDAGQIPFYTGLQTLYLAGLLNKDIAMFDYENRNKSEDFRENIYRIFNFKADYLFDYNPDVIVLNTNNDTVLVKDAFVEFLKRDERFKAYRFVKSFGENKYFYAVFSRN